MRIKAAILVSALFIAAHAAAALAQSLVSTITLGPDQIGLVQTAQGITTRISLPDQVEEIICGDLYDPNTGKGSFVVQRSGKDVFVKPIAAKGMSNLFVKTGASAKRTYNFDLSIVQVAQANRVVNVIDRQAVEQRQVNAERLQGSDRASGDQSAGSNAAEQLARQQAEDILRNARQQADQLVAAAQSKAAEIERQSTERAGQETGRRFVQALMLGLRETKINNPRVVAKKVIITLDPRVLVLDDKAYLRYTMQNIGSEEFTFSAVSVETGAGASAQSVATEVIQSKPENKLGPGEAMTGVMIFDPKLIGAKDRLTLFVRGEDNAEIAHVSIQ